MEADIQATLSGNETMEEIIERMGTPASVAGEFNDNFTPEERKQAKKEKRMKIVVAVIVICVLLTGFVYWFLPKTKEFGSSGKFTAERVEEQAATIINLVNTDDFEGLQEISNQTMGEMFVEEQQESWRQAKALLGNDWGAFVSLEDSFMVEVSQMGQNLAVISIKATYENVSVVYQLSFDEQMKLAGIFMR